MPKTMPKPNAEQVKKLLKLGVDATLKGLLSSAKAVAKSGVMTEDEAKAVINEAIDEFAAAN